MGDDLGVKDVTQILFQLQRMGEGHHTDVEARGLDPKMAMLRRWQSARLARTHADLLADERYASACRFFLSDIYAPRDFSQRDHDVERMYRFMSKFLPDRTLHSLALVVALNELTNELDEKLLRVLVDDLSVTDSITGEAYATAYRICDNYVERERQIDLIIDIGYSVDHFVHTRFIGTTLRLARGPAHRAGWHELHDFLERGYKAFKDMGDADYFLQTVEAREKRIMGQLFTGDPHPFQV
jgi:hypothetical protein